jgi:hypothetical protein
MRQALHDETSVPGVVARIASVWAAIGITSWADFAAFLGALYTGYLLAISFWKNTLRPFLEHMGWIQRRARRKDDKP